ncbi:tyrosine-protein phosphatase non-receptor type substrate 1-like, partial [Clarias magur]
FEGRVTAAEEMKHLPLHTLVLLCVLFYSGSCTVGKRWCEHKLVHVGENVTIKCSITNPDQDGVFLFTQREETREEDKVLYYYAPKQVLTLEIPYSRDRVKINGDFRDFSVSISNVSKFDMGFYWCRFNKLDKYINSSETFLFVQPEIIHTCKGGSKEECIWKMFAYILAGMFIFTLIILVVVL